MPSCFSLGSWTSSFLSITQLHFISDDMTTFTSKSSLVPCSASKCRKFEAFFNWIAPSVMCELIWCCPLAFNSVFELSIKLFFSIVFLCYLLHSGIYWKIAIFLILWISTEFAYVQGVVFSHCSILRFLNYFLKNK